MKARVDWAHWEYLLRLGPGSGASLLGSRENCALIPLCDPPRGHRWVATGLWCSPWVTVCLAWLHVLHDTCVALASMFETWGKVLRVCANALTSSPPASKRSHWSPHFIILHGPGDVQGVSHASKHTPGTCWEPFGVFFCSTSGGYRRVRPPLICRL